MKGLTDTRAIASLAIVAACGDSAVDKWQWRARATPPPEPEVRLEDQ